jgi:hypothetical protein
MRACTVKRIEVSQSIAASRCIDETADLLQSRDSRSHHVVERGLTTEQEMVVWPNDPFIGRLIGQKNMQGFIDPNNIRNPGQFVLTKGPCGCFQFVDG